MRVAAWVLTVVSLVLWCFAGAATRRHPHAPALPVEVSGAGAATVLAGICWIAEGVRDRDKDALVRAMAEFTLQRGQAPAALRRVS